MQDFEHYDYTMTLEKLRRVLADPATGPIQVVINGEYYDLLNEKEDNKNE